MEQHVAEHESGARRLRPRGEADRRRGGEHRFDLIGLEELVEEVGGTLQEESLRQLFRFGALEHPEQIRQRRRGFEDHRLDEFHDLGPERHVLGIGHGVFLRDAREFPVVPLGVVPKENRFAVRNREEELWIEGTDLVAEAREVEVPDDLRPQQARGIREPRELDPREDLLRDARPSNDRPTFEDEDFQPGLRQIRRGDEAVVAPADDDGVPCRSHGPRSAAPLRIVSGGRWTAGGREREKKIESRPNPPPPPLPPLFLAPPPPKTNPPPSFPRYSAPSNAA